MHRQLTALGVTNYVVCPIRALVEKLPGLEVAGEASDGREVLDLIKAKQPGVVLMDISMPSLNGLQALARITRDFPHVRVASPTSTRLV